jgi:hypothetical protein
MIHKTVFKLDNKFLEVSFDENTKEFEASISYKINKSKIKEKPIEPEKNEEEPNEETIEEPKEENEEGLLI